MTNGNKNSIIKRTNTDNTYKKYGGYHEKTSLQSISSALRIHS